MKKLLIAFLLIGCSKATDPDPQFCYVCTTYTNSDAGLTQTNEDHCNITEKEALEIEASGSTLRKEVMNNPQNFLNVYGSIVICSRK